MTNLTESASWEPGVYQIELTDPVIGGPDGISNRQAKQLANRTGWLKNQVTSLGTDKQPKDATLTAIAAIDTVADRLMYSTGVDTFALTPLTAFIRTLLDDANQASALLTLGAAPLASPAFTGIPTAATAAAGTNTAQLATTAFVQAAVTPKANKATTLAGYGIIDGQPLDADLTALAALTTPGLYTNTGEGTAAARSIAVSGPGLSVANGNGVAGNPTLTNSGVTSVSGTANQVTVSAANGAVTFSLPQSIHNLATPAFAQVALGGDPVNALQAATKQYVDSLVSGLNVKVSVLVATTANITLSGTQTIDGVAVPAGERVLVKNQTTSSQNGLYIVAAGAWIRTTDADTWNELVSAFVFVERGTQNADTGWVCTCDPGGTLGTTAIVVAQFAGAGTLTAGAGISVNGNQVALSASGVTAGTYTKLTVDQFGRVTAATAMLASDVPDLDWAQITRGKPTSLGGYGIVLPNQAQAEAGADNTLPMTPLRVFQAIAKVVTQATEAAFGWAKVATQAQVNAGTDDTTFVTPKKLRAGFASLFAVNGYLALPAWLGGFMFQWGRGTASVLGASTPTNVLITFPVPFPVECFSATVNGAGNNSLNTYQYRYSIESTSRTDFLSSMSSPLNQTLTYFWFAIGR